MDSHYWSTAGVSHVCSWCAWSQVNALPTVVQLQRPAVRCRGTQPVQIQQGLEEVRCEHVVLFQEQHDGSVIITTTTTTTQTTAMVGGVHFPYLLCVRYHHVILRGRKCGQRQRDKRPSKRMSGDFRCTRMCVCTCEVNYAGTACWGCREGRAVSTRW